MSSKIKLRHNRKMLSIMMALVLSVCMVFSVTLQVSAETTANEKVNNVKNSVLQVRMIYQPDNEDVVIVSSGSCFLINSTTALSCAHIFTLDADFTAYAKSLYGEGHKVEEKNIKRYEVLVNGGVPVNVTLRKVNENADYSIIKIDETISRPTVTLGHSGSLNTTQEIYTLGYPTTLTSKQDSKVYSIDMVSVTNSTISNLSNENGVDLITHNAIMSDGNSGGPLVDVDGNVIGINLSKNAENDYFNAAGIDQVVALLDDLDIEYTRSDDDSIIEETDPEPAPEPETQVITEAPATEDVQPVAELGSLDNNNSDNNGGLDATKLIIIIAIAVLVVIVAVIVMIILLSNKKKSAEKVATPQRGSTVMPGPGVPPQVAPRPSQPPYGQPYNRPVTPPSSATVPSNEGAGETSVLNDGAGETTVLGNQSTGFTMIRKRNNEKININKPEYVIGKERRRVDYCISDNNSISRVHAKIKVRAGRCYIADLGSTNCTYVNGSKLSPNQEVILSKGDQIKVSDEEFEFLG